MKFYFLQQERESRSRQNSTDEVNGPELKDKKNFSE